MVVFELLGSGSERRGAGRFRRNIHLVLDFKLQ